MPLPVHLLAAIPGFRMLGQTSFGGYFKIIVTWWENDCPEILNDVAEFQSLSGMYLHDYNRYRPKIEPVLLKSIEILKEYRSERQGKREHRLINLSKAHAASRAKLLEKKKVDKSKGNLVDKHTLVNPTPIKPSSQPFHDGWNLNTAKSPNIKKQSPNTPMLTDK